MIEFFKMKLGMVRYEIQYSGQGYKGYFYICPEMRGSKSDSFWFPRQRHAYRRSDIDIAVSGGDFDAFYWEIKEHVHSLLTLIS